MFTLEEARKTDWYREMCLREMDTRHRARTKAGSGWDHWIQESMICQHRQGRSV